MKYIFIIIGILASSTFSRAQSELPWELERLDQDAYINSALNLDQTHESSAVFAEYYSIYKKLRTKNPADYFPEPTPRQLELRTYISNADSAEDLLLLADFLAEGTNQALEGLANCPYRNKETLAYRFVAAVKNNNHIEAGNLLDKMDELDMISPVMKSWGENAISNSNQKYFMTNGIQDLIGLSWALHKNDRFQDAILFNRYLNSITGIYTDDMEFLKMFPSAWISPTYEPSFLDRELDRLSLSGIGFKLKDQITDPYAEFRVAAIEFEGMGLACKTPADQGLVRSYMYFKDQTQLLTRKNDLDEFKELYEQLESYIKSAGSNK